jgi:hypothetical protein
LRSAWAIIHENRRAYLALNLAYYGLIALAMDAAMLDRSLHSRLTEWVSQWVQAGGLAPIMRLYSSRERGRGGRRDVGRQSVRRESRLGHVASGLGALQGLLEAGIRAILWGLIFAPNSLPAGPGQILSGGSLA